MPVLRRQQVPRPTRAGGFSQAQPGCAAVNYLVHRVPCWTRCTPEITGGACRAMVLPSGYGSAVEANVTTPTACSTLV